MTAGNLVKLPARSIGRELLQPRSSTFVSGASDCRKAYRWAQFLGLTDRAQEVNQQATVIQLAAPVDGASFADRWSSGETVDIAASESRNESNGELMPAEASTALQEPTAKGAVNTLDRVQAELF